MADADRGIEVSTPDMDVHKDNAPVQGTWVRPDSRSVTARSACVSADHVLQVAQDQRGFTRKGSGVKGLSQG